MRLIDHLLVGAVLLVTAWVLLVSLVVLPNMDKKLQTCETRLEEAVRPSNGEGVLR